MFTGIVAEAGVIEAIKPAEKSIQLIVRTRRVARGIKLGASVAVNGCCLTVVRVSVRGAAKRLHFDVLQETWQRTNLQFTRAGARVNLERPLRAGDEFGGHFVTGHVDGVGKILRAKKIGADYLMDIAAPAEVMRYVVFKGSIAVDGVSLTVAGVKPKNFQVWIIPHTLAVTALSERKVGAAVNLEADLLGKYVEKFLTRRNQGRK